MKNASLGLNVECRQSIIGLSSSTQTTQVCASLKACELLDDDRRAPVDILVALDVSGSMAGDKLKLCKSTLTLLLRQLTSEDSFGLISFSTDAIIEIPVSKLSTSARKAAIDKINSLYVRSSTNISAAIGLTAQEIQSMTNMNEVRSIFLLTDGEANAGIRKPDDICELAKNCLTNPDQPPISMHCFGYGESHNDDLLRKISSITAGGSYYFVQNDSSVSSAFGDALGGILSVVAQNAVLNIQVPEASREAGVKILDVYHDNKIRLEDWNFKVSIGDFYAEENRDILFQISLSNSDLTTPHINVSVSYTDTIEKMLVTSTEEPCHISRPEGNTLSTPSEHVEIQWLRIHTVQEMTRAKDMASKGQFKEAQSLIENPLELVQKHANVDHPMIRQLKMDLQEAKNGLTSSSHYNQRGSAYINTSMRSHKVQRCSRPMDQRSFDAYRGKKKTAMGLKFTNSTSSTKTGRKF